MLRQRLSNEDLIHLLKSRVDARGDVSADDFCREVGVSRSTINRRFGTWHELRRLAGLPPRKFQPATQRYSADDVMRVLSSIVEVEGDSLTYARFRQLSGVSDYTVTKHFGNWNSLRRRCGIAARSRRQPMIGERELLVDLERLTQRLGTFPTSRQIARYSRFAIGTYYTRYRSTKEMQEKLRKFRIENELERRLGTHWRREVFGECG